MQEDPRIKEFEFLCGDTVWFRNKKVINGKIIKSALTNIGKQWYYNIEVEYEEYDIWYNDGRMAKRGCYLIHREDNKTVFHSLEELNKYKKS